VLKHEYLSEFYNEKDMKEIKAARIKIQLHINDNKKLSLKDYRELIYSEINRKEARVLNSLNTNAPDSNSTHFKSRMANERPKKDLSKEKSKLKTQPIDHTESTHSHKNHTVYQSTEPKD
jgi:formamidopyrimidine-DNA glycosylase